MSDDEDEEESPSLETVRLRELRAIRQLAEANTSGLSQPSSSSRSVSFLPAMEESNTSSSSHRQDQPPTGDQTENVDDDDDVHETA